MGFFTKKKPVTEPSKPVEKKCEHKYQDFPWYLTWSVNTYDYTIEVHEPYVCIFCGDRIDKILSRYTGKGDGQQLIEKLHCRFDNHIKHREEVEDMINDMVLVDPEYLKYYHMLREQQDPSTSRPQDDKSIELTL